MKRSQRTIIYNVLLGIILFVPVNSRSQSGSTSSVSIRDTVKSHESLHSLYTTLGYGSNMIYLGATFSQNQPYEFSSLTYGFKDKIYVTATAIHLHERSPFVAFSSGSINYNHTFNSWFDLSGGISGYLVAPSLTDTLFNNFIYGYLTLGFDWRILYTKLSAGGLIYDGVKPFLQIRNSRFFKTHEFSKKKLSFSFDPYFNILFGSLTEYETTSGTTVTISPPYGKGGKYGQNTLSTKSRTFFTIMEADLGIPIAFNSDRFTVEAEPGYVFPMYDNKYFSRQKGFIFMLSAYFRIF